MLITRPLPSVTVGQKVTVTGTVWLDRDGYKITEPLAGVVSEVEPRAVAVKITDPASMGEAFARHLEDWYGLVWVDADCFEEDDLTIHV